MTNRVSPPNPDAALQILALNSGSSTLKFARFVADAAGVRTLDSQRLSGSDAIAIERLRARLDELHCEPEIVLHRIVHGGASLRQHCIIDAAVSGSKKFTRREY